MGFVFCGLLGLVLLLPLLWFRGYSEQGQDYTFVHDATSAPAISYYDYIIVGGGTAGCPLAATLSSNYNVLLLERGGSPYGNPNITNLSSFGIPLSDTSSTSPSQRFISEEGVVNARARVLGGGTSLNGGFYSYAEPDFVKNAGWDGKLVNESYQWVEKKLVFEPGTLSWQSAVRDGLLEAGILPNNGFTLDHINGTKVGGSIFDRNGHRHTAADLLQYANPERLTVLLYATVDKILFKSSGVPRPVAQGVRFSDAWGVKREAYLNKGSSKNEIILSAGTLGSPQLLMLSGVGPADHLRSHNISVLVDQPLVGQEVADNPLNLIVVPSPIDVEVSLIQVVGITDSGNYIEAFSGKDFLNMNGQPSAEKMNGTLDDTRAFRGGSIGEKVTGPLSTGHLELRNKNPNSNPIVTFNYFKEPEDLQRCVNGVKTIQKVVESNAFSKFRYPENSFEALLNMTETLIVNLRSKHNNSSSMSTLEQFCKNTVMTLWHYHGGCHVGKVVDHDYKVLGVNGLRVIDSSTFKTSPGTNPQATVMMLGRYMGIQILNERIASEESAHKEL